MQAIPTGARGGKSFVPTAVETVMTVSTSVPVEIKAITTQEIESKQHEEEAEKQAETLKKYEESLKTAEEHAKQLEEEAKAQLAAAAKKYQEAEAALKKQLEEAKKATPTRARLLTRALHKCKTLPRKRRARCVARAHREYGATRAQLLARALHKCKTLPKKRRARCVARAHKEHRAGANGKGRRNK